MATGAMSLSHQGHAMATGAMAGSHHGYGSHQDHVTWPRGLSCCHQGHIMVTGAMARSRAPCRVCAMATENVTAMGWEMTREVGG